MKVRNYVTLLIGKCSYMKISRRDLEKKKRVTNVAKIEE